MKNIIIALTALMAIQLTQAADFPALYCVSVQGFQNINQINVFTNQKGTMRINYQYQLSVITYMPRPAPSSLLASVGTRDHEHSRSRNPRSAPRGIRLAARASFGSEDIDRRHTEMVAGHARVHPRSATEI